jgi:hypothetical protein
MEKPESPVDDSGFSNTNGVVAAGRAGRQLLQIHQGVGITWLQKSRFNPSARTKAFTTLVRTYPRTV